MKFGFVRIVMIMILNKSEILKYINNNKMISEYVDLDIQLQPNGFDLTVKNISLYYGSGTIEFDNAKRGMPEYIAIQNRKSHHLEFGAYLIDYNEKIKIPNDIIALGYPRSSLLRIGVNVPSAVFDAGFEGYPQGMLIVNNKHGLNIHKNARVLQLIFLDREDDNSCYDGEYALPLFEESHV